MELRSASHPERNAQFEHINAIADECLQRHQPVVSVDTKKKELVGEFKNAGREWQPKNKPETALVHDFPHDTSGKAIPYGIYDMGRNEAWVNVGRDHDTPAFAVASIRRWWKAMGKPAYPNAEELFITADAGGSNGYRSHAWKHALQKFADETRLKVCVSHFPPGTSKWNKIEHRLFCHITKNWRGKTLGSFETIVDSIGNTRTPTAGLRVKAKLDKRIYPTGVKIPAAEMNALATSPRLPRGVELRDTSSIVHQSAPCLALEVEHIISIKTLTTITATKTSRNNDWGDDDYENKRERRSHISRPEWSNTLQPLHVSDELVPGKRLAMVWCSAPWAPDNLRLRYYEVTPMSAVWIFYLQLHSLVLNFHGHRQVLNFDLHLQSSIGFPKPA